MASGSDFITRYRQTTTSWLTALEDLLALKSQYDALDLGNSLTEEDFAGANSDISKDDLVAAVGSVDAMNALFQQGHDTNLYRLKV
jgi:hypothetical protein